MTAQVITGQEWERPRPAKDPISGPYWEAAARGELLIQHCASCGNRQWYPRAVCTACGETPQWEATAGRGTVHTFTIIRQNYAKPFRELLPYVVAMIELDEGPMLMGNLTDVDVDAVRIGMPVEVYMIEAEEGLGVPFWRPVTR